LDSTFDGDGKLTTNLGANDSGNSVTIQSDGKIVVAGESGNDFAVVRYRADGQLDSAVGSPPLKASAAAEYAGAIVLQTEGRAVVAGAAWNGGGQDFTVARYRPDGDLDPAFAGDGCVETRFGGGADAASAAAVQPDGKILAAGRTDATGGGDFALTRYLANGTLDDSFDGDSGTGNGLVTTSFASGDDQARGISLQNDGKIVVAGYTSPPIETSPSPDTWPTENWTPVSTRTAS